VFDAYGTLLDVLSTPTKRAVVLNLPPEFVTVWRETQNSHTWLRTNMGRYVDLLAVTLEAMNSTLALFNRTLTANESTYLLESWVHLKPFPEVKMALKEMQINYNLYILSNGTPEMLEKGMRNSRLRSYFKDVISVDRVRAFIPSRRVYAWLQRSASLRHRKRILFVSSNNWECAGAKSFGLKTAWISRNKMRPSFLGFPPDYTFSSLLELAEALVDLDIHK